MTDPTGGGYGALEWLCIEDRCLAACVSKEWHEASQSAALWEHWTFHVNHLLDREMQRDELVEPVHGQRANVLALLDLPRLSPRKTTTLHVQAPGDPPRGKTWAKPLDKPWRNPDGSYRHRWPRWMQLEYSIDVHERSVPPDRFFSYRGEWPICDGSYDGSSTETGEGDY